MDGDVLQYVSYCFSSINKRMHPSLCNNNSHYRCDYSELSYGRCILNFAKDTEAHSLKYVGTNEHLMNHYHETSG